MANYKYDVVVRGNRGEQDNNRRNSSSKTKGRGSILDWYRPRGGSSFFPSLPLFFRIDCSGKGVVRGEERPEEEETSQNSKKGGVDMKRSMFLYFVAILFSLTAITSHAASPYSVKMKYSNYFPVTHPYAVLGQQFCDEIQKQTNGKVEIAYYPGGTLTSPTAMFDGVVNRVSDIGLSSLLYAKGRFPVTEMLNLPVGYMNGYIATHVMQEFYERFKPKEWDKVHMLHLFATGLTVVGTTKKPVRTLEDLKGLKIRGTGRMADIVNALGGTAVGVGMPDAYDGLVRGVIDGTFDAMEPYKAWKLGEVLKYSTQSQGVGMSATMYVVMNKEVWGSLPDDVKKVFNEVSAQWMDKYGTASKELDEAGKDFLQKQGGQIIQLSDSEMNRWRKSIQVVFEENFKELEARGIKRSEAETYLKFINERVAHWLSR